MSSLLVPTVTEHTPRGDRMTDVYSRLLGERIVFIGTPIALPNARILLHQPHGGAEGQTTDIQIAAQEMLLMREQIEELLAERTNQSRHRIAEDLERDYILRGAAAVDYGVIDEIIDRRPEPTEVGLAAPRS